MGWIGKFQAAILGDPAPYFLRQKNLGTFMEALGIVYDIFASNLALGLRLSQPLRCDESALPYLSFDRGIRLYPSEPIASQRFRLSQWWQLWKQRGSHQGAMRHLQPYFLGASGLGPLPTIRIVHASGDGLSATWHTLSGGVPGAPGTSVYSAQKVTPSNFDFDSNGTNSATDIAAPWQALTPYLAGQTVTNDGRKLYVCITAGTSAASGGPTGTSQNITDGSAHWRYAKPWSRYYAFIETNAIDVQAALAHYDDPNTDYDDPGLYYDGLAPQVAADLVAMLADWKAAHSALWTVALSTVPIDPTATPTQDADGWWSLPGNGEWGRLIDATTHKATRPPYLTFLLDRSQP